MIQGTTHKIKKSIDESMPPGKQREFPYAPVELTKRKALKKRVTDKARPEAEGEEEDQLDPLAISQKREVHQECN